MIRKTCKIFRKIKCICAKIGTDLSVIKKMAMECLNQGKYLHFSHINSGCLWLFSTQLARYLWNYTDNTVHKTLGEEFLGKLQSV